MLQIQYPRLISRLIARFQGRETSPSPSPVVIPPLVVMTTDADVLLSESKWKTATVDCSASNATAFTVPAGKRWKVFYLGKSTTTGATGILIKDDSEGTQFGIMADTTSATYIYDDFYFEEGDLIILGNSSNGGDTARTVTVGYIEEDSY